MAVDKKERKRVAKPKEWQEATKEVYRILYKAGDKGANFHDIAKQVRIDIKKLNGIITYFKRNKRNGIPRPMVETTPCEIVVRSEFDGSKCHEKSKNIFLTEVGRSMHERAGI